MIRYRSRAFPILAAVFLLGAAPSYGGSPENYSFEKWKTEFDQRFERNPKLRDVPGSGWKPYNRLRWFFDQRLGNGQDVPPRTRWDAGRRLLARGVDRNSWSVAWRSLGPTNIAGRILSIAFDGSASVAYAGSASGGLWRSTDRGASWAPMTDDLPSLAVGAVCVLPTNPPIVIIGTGEPTLNSDAIGGVGILRSADGGVSWQETNVVSTRTALHSGYSAIVANAGAGVLLAGGRDGLWRSTDAGVSWSSLNSTRVWTDLLWKPGSADTAFAAAGGIYVSADSGKTFEQVTQGLPGSNQIGGLVRLAACGSNPDIVYAAISEAGTFATLGIYRSVDGGATWQLRSTQNLYGSQGWYNNTILVDPADPNHVFAGGIWLWESVDGGASWRVIAYNLHEDQHALCMDSMGVLWAGNDGGVFASPDTGTTWIPRNEGLVTAQFYAVCGAATDTTRSYGGTQDNGTLLRIGSPQWLYGPPGDGGRCHCDRTNPDRVYGESELGDHFASYDRMETWGLINDGLEGTSLFIAPVDMDLHDGNTLFTSTNAGIFRTRASGQPWELVDPVAKYVSSISVGPASSRWVWALDPTWHLVRISSDGGDSWHWSGPFPFPASGSLSVIADPRDSLSAFATFSYSSGRPQLIARTADGGRSWQDVTGDLRDVSVTDLVVDPGRPGYWYVATDLGVWCTTDAGQTWAPFGVGLPQVVVDDLDLQASSKVLLAGTHGRGLWEAPLPDSSPPRLAAIPLRLESPLPNPSRGLTTFRYTVPEGERFELTVFDVAGRKVRSLVASTGDGLQRSCVWEPSGVSVGLYFVRLQTPRRSRVSKLVVLR